MTPAPPRASVATRCRDRHGGRGSLRSGSIFVSSPLEAREPNEGAHGGNRVSPVKRAVAPKAPLRSVVERTGIEPVTSGLQSRTEAGSAYVYAVKPTSFRALADGAWAG